MLCLGLFLYVVLFFMIFYLFYDIFYGCIVINDFFIENVLFRNFIKIIIYVI